MRRFRFRYEALSKLREQEEDAALKVFGEAQRRFQDAVQRKQHLLSELDLSLQRREIYSAQSSSISPVALEDDYVVGTKVRIVQADQSIFREQKKLEKAFRGYLEARKKRMTLEKIRERDLKRHLRQKRRKERKSQDELYVMRPKRRVA